MAKKQESANDLFQMAKDYAAAEQELAMERWMYVSIERKTDTPHEWKVLKTYDLPLEVYNRRQWVIRWREARFIDRHPRSDVTTRHSPYSKVQGVNIGMKADLDKLVAAKARLTKQNRLLHEYMDAHKDDLFFDPDSDEQLQKVLAKVKVAEQSIKDAEARLRDKVEEFRKTENNIKKTTI